MNEETKMRIEGLTAFIQRVEARIELMKDEIDRHKKERRKLIFEHWRMKSCV